MKHAIYVKKA